MAKFNEIDAQSNSINQVSAGTTIKGDVNSDGDLRFDGILTGNLVTKGKVVIGATGSVTGEIICANAVIEGTVEGKITASEMLSLKATAVIKGDISINKLAIEPGCKFSGNCKMNNGETVQIEESETKPA